jgi:hypothetical protein
VEGRFARGEIPGRALMDHGEEDGKGIDGAWQEILPVLISC